jgi:acylphosphatase
MNMSQNSDSTEPGLKSCYFRVTGRVQGVFFRAATKAIADRYGLSGWVRNLPDGAVEGTVSGESMRLKIFLKWLKEGPEMARVLKLEVKDIALEEFDRFEIR